MASFGENLRKERELRGISIREIADATKISVRFLEGLEKDSLDALPGGLFRRAFVRQYAIHLGLDADRLVSEFLHAFPEEHTSARAPEPATPSTAAHPGTAFLLALVAIGGVLSVLKLGGTEPGTQPAHQGVVLTPPPAVVAAADPVYPPPSSPRATPEPMADGLLMTMNVTQDCWVEIRIDGQLVLSRVLTRGESHTFEADGEIVLSAGNAGGLSFSAQNSESLPFGDAGEVRRNIRITKQNLGSFLADPASIPASQSS
jgi:cytoskeletal protein RodZ